MAEESRKPDTYAIIIGIDFYPNANHDGRTSLHGCVADARMFEKLMIHHLTSDLSVPEADIPKYIHVLTSTHTDPTTLRPYTPLEVSQEKLLPTARNILQTMLNVQHIAQAGDNVFISYSGHGGREKTVVRGWKGKSSGLDETLCPYDVKYGGLSIRDFVLNYVFGLFVEKEIRLTVFLDSCHSGGASRAVFPDQYPEDNDDDDDDDDDEEDPPAVVRSMPVTSYVKPEITAKEYWSNGKGALAHMRKELHEAWHNMMDHTTHFSAAERGKAPGLLKLHPVGYALFAGCLEHELSAENFGAGYLSSAATDALRTLVFSETASSPRKNGVPLRWVHRVAFDQVYREIRGRLQSPLVLGEAGFGFLTGGGRNLNVVVPTDGTSLPIRTGPTVDFPLRVRAIPRSSPDPETLPSLLLRAGAAHGIVVGSEYALFRWFEDVSFAPVQVRVVVTEVREMVSVITLAAPLTTLPDDWKALANAQVQLQNARRTATINSKTRKRYKPLKKAYPWPMGCIATLLSEPDGASGGSNSRISRFNRLLSISNDTNSYVFDLAITASGGNGKQTHNVTFTWRSEYASALNKPYANIVSFYFSPRNHSIRKVYPVEGEFESIDAGDRRVFSFDEEHDANGLVKVIVFWASSSFDWWQMGPGQAGGPTETAHEASSPEIGVQPTKTDKKDPDEGVFGGWLTVSKKICEEAQ